MVQSLLHHFAAFYWAVSLSLVRRINVHIPPSLLFWRAWAHGAGCYLLVDIENRI